MSILVLLELHIYQVKSRGRKFLLLMKCKMFSTSYHNSYYAPAQTDPVQVGWVELPAGMFYLEDKNSRDINTIFY